MGKAKKSEKIVDEIVRRVSEGEALRQICRDLDIHWNTVYLWMDSDKDFSVRIARARELGEQAISEECLAIADDGQNDWMEKIGSDGQSLGWQLNGEHVQRSKLRIETRLKLLAKWNPKKWGDKVEQTHQGPDGGALQIRSVKLTPLTADD